MSASLPPANNLIMLGVIGIGAYWFLTRRAIAAPPPAAARPGGAGSNPVNTAVDLVSRLFSGGVPLLGTTDGRSATQWDVTPFGPTGPSFNNPSAYVAAGNDGLAFNPVNASPWDYTNEAWY